MITWKYIIESLHHYILILYDTRQNMIQGFVR